MANRLVSEGKTSEVTALPAGQSTPAAFAPIFNDPRAPMGNVMMLPRCTFKIEKCADGCRIVCSGDGRLATGVIQNLCTMLAGSTCTCSAMTHGQVTYTCNLTMGPCRCELTETGVCITCTSDDSNCVRIIQASTDCLRALLEIGCTCCLLLNNTPICTGGSEINNSRRKNVTESGSPASASVQKMRRSQGEPADDQNRGRRDIAVTTAPVPDFFQEETTDAIRLQVDWLVRELGVDDSFFAKLLGTNESTISKWRRNHASDLPEGGIESLRALWRTMLHLLSFLNFDQARVRDLFLQKTPVGHASRQSPLIPPWGGDSLRTYLEKSGTNAIEKVDSWVTGLRFGDPYAA
jgi:hypothetical protein